MADQSLTQIYDSQSPQITEIEQGWLLYFVDNTVSPAVSYAVPAEYTGIKVPLETITATGSESPIVEFDFGPNIAGGQIPQMFKRLWLHGRLRSTDTSSSAETVCIYFNDDTTDTNYHSQWAIVNNTTYSDSEGAYPRVTTCPTDHTNSVADSFSTFSIVVEDYTSTTKLHMASSVHTAYLREASYLAHQFGPVTVWDIPGSPYPAITRLRLRTDDHPSSVLYGTVTLYGEI